MRSVALIAVPEAERIVWKKVIVEENGWDIFQNCWDVKATDSKDFLQTPSIRWIKKWRKAFRLVVVKLLRTKDRQGQGKDIKISSAVFLIRIQKSLNAKKILVSWTTLKFT